MPRSRMVLIYGLAGLTVGITASLQSAIYQTPLPFSASVISLENMPTSTAPVKASVRPLPAPPACISNRTSGCVLLYASAHFCAKGYKAKAPENEIDTPFLPVLPVLSVLFEELLCP